MNRKLYLLLSTILISYSAIAQSQKPIWFVDGFHGGIYGHYPIKTYTDYMSDLLDKYPDWSMCLEIEPETWDTVKVVTPDAYKRFAELTKSDRVEYTNPAYAQAYMYNISGESVIRQFEYGIEKLKSHFPWMTFDTYAVEEPCFTSCLPMVLTQFGFKYAVIRCPNTCWGGYPAAFGGELVNWIGPDGSSILSVPRSSSEALHPKTVWQTMSSDNNEEYIEACFENGIEHPVGMCYQDAGWTNGPWLGYGEKAKTRSIYTTWRKYISEVADKSSAIDWHFSQEDVRAGLVWGSQIAQRLAQQVRQAENTIVKCEKITAIGSCIAGFKPDQKAFDEAWRTLLLSQHHDCWIVPYNRLNKYGNWADNVKLWTDNTILLAENQAALATDAMANHSSTESVSVRVINVGAYPRREWVESLLPEQFASSPIKVTNAAGKVVPSQVVSASGSRILRILADVPSFGFATYAIRNARKNTSTQAVKYQENVIENSRYAITFDPNNGGVITSLIDKTQGGYEYVDNSSSFAFGELRGFLYDEGHFISSKDAPAKVTINYNDNGVATAIISGVIAGSPFTQTITISDTDSKIACNLRIDWEGDPGFGKFRQKDAHANGHRAFYNGKYKLNFLMPLSMKEPQLYKDAPFDVCKSNLDDTEYENWTDIKHDIIVNWLDLSENVHNGHGFALLSDHTTSYTYADDYPLGLTIQYSGNGLWGRNYSITHPTDINFCLMPHTGNWDTADVQKESNMWHEPMKAVIGNFELCDKSLVSIEGDGYELSAVNMTDNGLMIRIFNASSDESVHNLKLGFVAATAYETDLNGNLIKDLTVHSVKNQPTIDLSMPRFSIKTIIVK